MHRISRRTFTQATPAACGLIATAGSGALATPGATVAIPGMTRARHVADFFRAARGPVPDAGQRGQMEAGFDAL